MGKKGFNRKKAVRFVLVPGPEKDGKPTVLFKPVETRKTQVSKKQRKAVISKLGDYEQITINGKQVDENEIPAFVLEQIRGRSNLVYNQIHPEEQQEEEVGDMYDIQDGDEGDEPEYQHEEKDYEGRGGKIEEQADDQDWEDQEEGEQEEGDQVYQQEIIEEAGEKYMAKEEDFPQLPALQTVSIEGKEYSLTKAQIDMLDTVIPQNYEQMDFGGLKFKKYNEDGLLLSEKEKYEPYLLGDNEKVVVVDTYQYVPTHAVNTVDNDLKPAQITKDLNIKAVEDALNYEGEVEVYEQLQDDFFAKMIKGELEVKKQRKVQEKPKKEAPTAVQPKSQPVVANNKKVQKEMDEQLESAIFNYDHNIEQNKDKDKLQEEDSEEQQDEKQSNTNLSMNFTDIQKREGYLGRDGELDWRMLTKKEKKEYMKTKVIREYYDELREREIEEKMKGISNVRPEELHLKQLVRHITYEDDHVMQQALAEDLKKQVHLSDEDEQYFESDSDQDDIVSFHQKTSIIAGNLSVIEQPRKKKNIVKKEEGEEPGEHELTKIKIIPEQRDRNETKEERQERKKKLKELKKERRQQRGEFVEKFNKQKKETMKRENANNPLSKVSLVKIY